MSGYFYSREAGAEGQILTGEGTAPGVGLDALLDRERPPLRAALAIGSALADVLCIAAEDRLVHGDIRPAHVKIDERGTVSVEGYGVQRRTTKAPEGKPEGHQVDVYGLGVVLHSILSAEPLGALPKDPDGHDDEVVSRVLAMDFRQVQGKRWLEDVRKFLCQILAWSPQDRPEPLDAANVLASVAAQCPGEGLEDWARRVTAAPARAAAAAPAARPRVEEEDLGGPVALAGPIAKGGVRQAPAAKGESTAFWSREKIAAMLAEDDEDDAPVRQTVSLPPKAEPSRPAPPSRPAAPPPRPPEPQVSRPPEPPPPPTPRAEPPRAEPPRPVTPDDATVRASSPFAGARIEASAPVEEPEPKKKSPMVWVAVAGVVLVLLCGGLTLGGGGLYYFAGSGASGAAAEADDAAVEKAEAEKAKAEAAAKAAADAAEMAEDDVGTAGAAGSDAAPATGSAAKAAGATPAPAPKASAPTTTTKSTAPATTKSTAPKTSAPKTSAPATTKATAPATSAPAPAPATGSFSVKFSTPGREAKLQCGDGQTSEFAGATTMSFSGTTTCLVRIDSGKGAVQVSRTATVTCSEDAGKVTCAGG